MKCPRCGAVSSVLDTRTGQHGQTIRRRQCFNMHKFSTWEVLPETFNRRDLAAGLRTSLTRVTTWARNAAIRRSTLPNTKIAAKHGITEARVRQIKKETP